MSDPPAKRSPVHRMTLMVPAVIEAQQDVDGKWWARITGVSSQLVEADSLVEALELLSAEKNLAAQGK